MPGMMDTILNLGLNDGDDRGPRGGVRRRRRSRRTAARASSRCSATSSAPTPCPEDPWLQLRAAIEAVFRSWNSDRARTYRAARRDRRRPRDGRDGPGDGLRQPERGLRHRRPVHAEPGDRRARPLRRRDVQRPGRGRRGGHAPHRADRRSSTSGCRRWAGELRDYAARLERHHADLCDIEFTIEHGRLWMLQCRVGKRSPRPPCGSPSTWRRTRRSR